MRVGARPERRIFKKHGLALEVLYTQGSGEAIQVVLSGSVDVGIGPGTHAVFGAFSKGAPIRMIGASFTGARDQLYYVVPTRPFAA